MKPVFIKQIAQKDNFTFSIEWNDGICQDFQLSAIQRLCPCANCVDEHTGKRLVDPHLIKDHVKAIAIHSVGRYALRIEFASGCSSGIYSFDFLRNIGK